MCKCSGLKGYDLNEAYSLQKSAGLEGAYDLPLQFRFLLANVSTLNGNDYRILEEHETNFGKPALSAISLISYMYYSLGKSSYGYYFSDNFY